MATNVAAIAKTTSDKENGAEPNSKTKTLFGALAAAEAQRLPNESVRGKRQSCQNSARTTRAPSMNRARQKSPKLKRHAKKGFGTVCPVSNMDSYKLIHG